MSPIIPIEIRSANRWYDCLAFVDSGATFSIFDRNEAYKMNISLEDGVKEKVIVGNGQFIIVYLHNLPIRIGHWEFNAQIGFSKDLGVGFNLLGRKDIFETLRVCFNDKDKELTFQKL